MANPRKSPIIQGEVLRALREEAGASLRFIADRVGCSYQHLSKVERGERPLTEGLSKAVAQALTQYRKENKAA